MKEISNKSYIAVMCVSVLCLIVIIVSVTYAYFTPRIVGDGKEVNVLAGKVKISISESKINVSNLAPIYDSTKDTKAQKNEFTISRTDDSNLNACYSLYLVVDEIGTNLKSQYFKYELDYGGATPVTGDFSTYDNYTPGEDGKVKIPLIGNQSLTDSKTSNSYILRLWLSYDPLADQTSILTGSADTRKFSARIMASGQSGKCPSETD